MSEKSASRIPVLITSSLKPVKDTRAWGKLGLSLRETGQFELSFMGFSPKALENYEDEKYYTSISKAHSGWGRIYSQIKFLKILLIVKPKILICCTYEYLAIASIFKGILEYKLVYDVQENYVKNLELNPTLSPSKKSKLSRLINWLERTNGVDLFLLAEKCYAEEMPEKTPFLILENTFAGIIRPVKTIQFEKKKGYRFLISGTLTPAFGTLEAINWFKEILKEFPESTLKIIGHCSLDSFKIELHKACENIAQIKLKASNLPVPHEEIIIAYSGIDFAILPYQNRDAIKDKMPTKLFESAALGVPVLIGGNPKWLDFLAPFSGGFPIDFFDFEHASLQFNAALNQTYFTQSPEESILWKSQHSDFISAINSL
ncbi:glycosyltransferase involved in cell wall biosynthesis [Algoriphagus ratkowskyi]|uniref:Glycosyltransferase family 4 protein n=1 Tax=Algoriphagus ratkowskyi TaxID=57028 RepID=A0A2W7S1G7_9BACT|nr:glycosyltransferase [Algoriphagus ratkowskyi]PZX56985.1 glycosyltransferase involved in cell wall biosynthesis [Algoriphagus ratkowskyi]TXD79891.1 glycosyltransferase family 4 protein [Algoriphagus ratkowskyi]